MASGTLFFKAIQFIHQLLFKRPKSPCPTSHKESDHRPMPQLLKYPFLSKHELSNHTLVCEIEGALLKSTSLFPYFMLVAFEAGGPFRAFVLLLFYPLVRCVNREMAVKAMVMVSFFGIREEGFRVGRAVLPKYFLENVSLELYEVLKGGGKRVGVSDMPRVMVEGFLKEYMGVEVVLGRELKVVCGYYVGLMKERRNVEKMGDDVVGIASLDNLYLHQKFFQQCKVMCWLTEADKRNFHALPRDKYPRPLIFHDGRLAFRPTPLATLAMFMWVPFGLFLAILRYIASVSLPYRLSIPIESFLGMRLRFKIHNPSTSDPALAHPNKENPKGILYVCNHRTLLDPLYLSVALNKPIPAVTYSLSPITEATSLIKTVRLMRNREEDRKKMDRLLRQGDLVVCPEGTTCREPFLLRFSPLFAELNVEIVPVAVDVQVSMFYGTTATGLKFLDPLFFLMNPSPGYFIQVLEKVPKEYMCGEDGGVSRIDVANFVQGELGKALGFACTELTRKDKYLMLAGNEGIVPSDEKSKRNHKKNKMT